jgi:hypothetical protein
VVTLHDPALERLIEVNPVPEGFELPPVSDVVLFESILERVHSEELSFRPTPVRLWRPGMVVAVAAFVAVLVVAAAMSLLTGIFSEQEGPVVTEPPVVTTVAPVPTPEPPVVTTVAPVPTTVGWYEVTISDPDDGSFSASGSAVDAGVVCGEGTIDTITISKDPMTGRFPPGGEYSDRYAAVEEQTLTCADGSGAIVVAVNVNQSQLMSGFMFTGEWVVVAGTGDHERVAGRGDVDGGCDPDRSNCSHEYTGRLDLSRDLGTATTAGAPTGRHDVAITYEGGFENGLFTATGRAIDAGLWCPAGVMVGISESRADGSGSGDWEHTFFCADGTGWMTIGIDARESVGVGYRGPWTVLGGSGAYAAFTGAGTFSGVTLDEGRSHTWTYAGQIENSE